MEVWEKHLEIQHELDDIAGVEYFSQDKNFLNASEIVDLGCGYGQLVSALSRCFPEKHFVGIDNDPDAIDFCLGAYHSEQNLDFILGDLETLDNSKVVSDYVIAKLLVQHVSNYQELSRTLARILQSNGVVVIVDIFDRFKRFIPEVPEYNAIFSRFRQLQLRNRNGSNIQDLPVFLTKEGFDVVSETAVNQYAGRHIEKRAFHKMLSVNLRVLLETYSIQGDYKQAQCELDEWLNAAESLACLGTYILKCSKQ